jgi:hypothetical protein
MTDTQLTFEQILAAVQARRPCSEATLRRYLRKLEVRPIGSIKMRPSRFAPDAMGKVLAALGLPQERLPSLKQLGNARAKAQRARAA